MTHWSKKKSQEKLQSILNRTIKSTNIEIYKMSLRECLKGHL